MFGLKNDVEVFYLESTVCTLASSIKLNGIALGQAISVSDCNNQIITLYEFLFPLNEVSFRKQGRPTGKLIIHRAIHWS
jgi:hypothetical protein